MIGLEFTNKKDGSKDWFDPINEYNYSEDEDCYFFISEIGEKYQFDKSEYSLRQYELCASCGYEIKNNECINSNCGES